jgi:hypothetical protein
MGRIKTFSKFDNSPHFGVSVTSAIFFKRCGSPSFFNLLSMLKIKFSLHRTNCLFGGNK